MPARLSASRLKTGGDEESGHGSDLGMVNPTGVGSPSPVKISLLLSPRAQDAGQPVEEGGDGAVDIEGASQSERGVMVQRT